MENKYFNDGDISITERLQGIKKRWLKAKADKADAEYLEQLILNDYVSNVRGCMTGWQFVIPYITSAIQEIGKKKKKERENLTFVEYKVHRDFFKGDERFKIKIDNIITGGFEGYYYNLVFSIDGKAYEINIPNRDKLNSKNFFYANEGKFAFFERESGVVSSVIFSEFDEEIFANKIFEYFDKGK